MTGQPVADTSDKVTARLDDLADLLQKREALRRVYRLLRSEWSQHPNCKSWLYALERSNAAISRRIDLTMRSLMWGI